MVRPSIYGSLLSPFGKQLCQKCYNNKGNILFFRLLLFIIVSINDRGLQKDDLLIIFAKDNQCFLFNRYNAKSSFRYINGGNEITFKNS